jgi:hypothetical protein
MRIHYDQGGDRAYIRLGNPSGPCETMWVEPAEDRAPGTGTVVTDRSGPVLVGLEVELASLVLGPSVVDPLSQGTWSIPLPKALHDPVQDAVFIYFAEDFA